MPSASAVPDAVWKTMQFSADWERRGQRLVPESRHKAGTGLCPNSSAIPPGVKGTCGSADGLSAEESLWTSRSRVVEMAKELMARTRRCSSTGSDTARDVIRENSGLSRTDPTPISEPSARRPSASVASRKKITKRNEAPGRSFIARFRRILVRLGPTVREGNGKGPCHFNQTSEKNYRQAVESGPVDSFCCLASGTARLISSGRPAVNRDACGHCGASSWCGVVMEP